MLNPRASSPLSHTRKRSGREESGADVCSLDVTGSLKICNSLGLIFFTMKCGHGLLVALLSRLLLLILLAYAQGRLECSRLLLHTELQKSEWRFTGLV